MSRILGIILLVIGITLLVTGEVISINNSKMSVSFKNIDKPYVLYVEKDGYVKKPSDPQKSGYSFIGWYSNDSEFDFNKKITNNVTVEARWEKSEDFADESHRVIVNSVYEAFRRLMNFD